MPRYTFPAGDLTAEHRSTPVQEVVLDVVDAPPPAADAKPTPGPAFLRGPLQVTGELAIDTPAGENRFRPGMVATLRLAAPDGRHCRVAVLLTANTGIAAAAPGRRTYRWAFLVPAHPAADTTGIFPKQAQREELTLEELVLQLGGSPGEVAKFTSEGGLAP